MTDYPQTLDEWRKYLAESLKPLVTIGTTEQEQEFATYETGGRILEMEEHLDRVDYLTILLERGITPAMKSEYKHTFLAEVRNYIKNTAKREE